MGTPWELFLEVAGLYVGCAGLWLHKSLQKSLRCMLEINITIVGLWENGFNEPVKSKGETELNRMSSWYRPSGEAPLWGARRSEGYHICLPQILMQKEKTLQSTQRSLVVSSLPPKHTEKHSTKAHTHQHHWFIPQLPCTLSCLVRGCRTQNKNDQLDESSPGHVHTHLTKLFENPCLFLSFSCFHQ